MRFNSIHNKREHVGGRKHLLVMQKIDPNGDTGEKSAEKTGEGVRVSDGVEDKDGDTFSESNTFNVTVGESNMDIPIFSEEFLNHNRSKL